MAEKKRESRWRELLITVLLLILLAEMGMALLIRNSSQRARKLMPEVQHASQTAQLSGMTLYESGRNPQVDQALLTSLSQIQDKGGNAVRIPADILSHMSGDAIEGGWMGQLATLMEMVFMVNGRVVLSVADTQEHGITAQEYASVWARIDEAFGHRPARELWYELCFPADVDQNAWAQCLETIIGAVRARNGERKLLIVLDSAFSAEQREQMALSFASEDVQIGVYADWTTDMEQLAGLQSQLAARQSSLMVIEAEQAEDDGLGTWLAESARQGGMGCVLQGN